MVRMPPLLYIIWLLLNLWGMGLLELLNNPFQNSIICYFWKSLLSTQKYSTILILPYKFLLNSVLIYLYLQGGVWS